MSVNDVSGFNVNKKLDETVYQGNRGDCALITYCEGLSQSEKGQSIFENSIDINKNENNEVTGYTVNFAGIGESYDVSLEELEQATVDKEQSSGWKTIGWDDLSEDEKEIYREIYSDWSEEALQKLEIQEQICTPEDSDYSSGDDDMRVVELAVEKCFEQSENQEVQNLKQNKYNTEDSLYGINPKLLNYMYVGNTQGEEVSSVYNTMQYVMDSYNLDTGYYTPNDTIELADKDGNTTSLNKNKEYEVITNSKDEGEKEQLP